MRLAFTNLKPPSSLLRVLSNKLHDSGLSHPKMSNGPNDLETNEIIRFFGINFYKEKVANFRGEWAPLNGNIFSNIRYPLLRPYPNPNSTDPPLPHRKVIKPMEVSHLFPVL